MDTRNWKERVVGTRTRSAEARGEKLAVTEAEIKKNLSEVADRGGIVFVSPEAKQEFEGDKVNG